MVIQNFSVFRYNDENDLKSSCKNAVTKEVDVCSLAALLKFIFKI